MGFLRSLQYWYALLDQSTYMDPIVVRQNAHQAELAAIAGPKRVNGHRLPVRVALRSEPNAERGRLQVQCWIEGKIVGDLDDHTAISMHAAVVAAENAGRPITLDGYIIGGGSRPGDEHETYYEVVFKDDFGDDPEDEELEQLLELDT